MRLNIKKSFIVIIVAISVYLFGYWYSMRDAGFSIGSALILTFESCILCIALIIGITNYQKIKYAQAQLLSVENLVQELSAQSDKRYLSLCQRIQNNREVGLDIYNELQGER